MAPENQSVRLKCCAVLTYPTSTKGSLCFLILRCGNLKNTTEYYRIVFKCSWKSALITNENTKSLQIGSVNFLEISIDSQRIYSLMFIFLTKLESIFFRNQGHYRLVLHFFWKSALNTENDYKMVLLFLANQQLAPWAHQITTNWFFSFGL